MSSISQVLILVFWWLNHYGTERSVVMEKEVEVLSLLRAGSWVIYDFANTIYSFAIVTFLLPPTMEKIFHSNLPVSVVMVSSMVFAGFIVPVLGVLTDRRPWSKKILIWSTVFCVACCIVMAFLIHQTLQQPEISTVILNGKINFISSAGFSLFAICFFFFLANAFYQIGLMLYNSLLVVSVPKKYWGRIGGIGVAVGYGGSMFAMVLFYITGVKYEPAAMVLGAVSFLVFTIPLLLFVPEREIVESETNKDIGLLEPLKKILHALKDLPKNRPLFLGLTGNLLCVDALNTLILFMTTYAIKTVYIGQSPLDDSVKSLMIGLIISATVWSIINGFLTDRIGSIPTLLFSAIMLEISLLCGVFMVNDSQLFFLTVVGTGGAGLSGMWIAGRTMVAQLSPLEQRGLFFGLYGMTNKLGALSSIVFAALTFYLPLVEIAERTSYRFALSFLLIPVAIGATLFAMLMKAESPTNESKPIQAKH